MLKNFNDMSNTSHYSYQINQFEFDKSITFFRENKHLIQKHNEFNFNTLKLI